MAKADLRFVIIDLRKQLLRNVDFLALSRKAALVVEFVLFGAKSDALPSGVFSCGLVDLAPALGLSGQELDDVLTELAKAGFCDLNEGMPDE